MFSRESRYKTRGVDEAISEQLQYKLWQILDNDLNEGKPLGYLQVFELITSHVDGMPVQQVRQRQEQPKRNRIHTLTGIVKPVSNVTVWVIDSGTYSTMLLPSEY
ncbi:DUF960 family protein [Paenibacillus validus]|uniref:DUF960 family protein n=1 Tax=Paenibacillus validus TaxID=44253 RepID=UPI003D27966C